MPFGPIRGLFRRSSGGPSLTGSQQNPSGKTHPCPELPPPSRQPPRETCRSPLQHLPQQSEKSWALGTWGSGTGQPKPRSLGVNGQVGASCLSSRMVWLGIDVLYRKLAMEDGVAVGGRSWGVTLEAWPCRPQSRDPLGSREIPFISTSAFASRPPSSGGLGEGEETVTALNTYSCLSISPFTAHVTHSITDPGYYRYSNGVGWEPGPTLWVGMQAWQRGYNAPDTRWQPPSDPGLYQAASDLQATHPILHVAPSHPIRFSSYMQHEVPSSAGPMVSTLAQA